MILVKNYLHQIHQQTSKAFSTTKWVNKHVFWNHLPSVSCIFERVVYCTTLLQLMFTHVTWSFMFSFCKWMTHKHPIRNFHCIIKEWTTPRRMHNIGRMPMGNYYSKLVRWDNSHNQAQHVLNPPSINKLTGGGGYQGLKEVKRTQKK